MRVASFAVTVLVESMSLESTEMLTLVSSIITAAKKWCTRLLSTVSPFTINSPGVYLAERPLEVLLSRITGAVDLPLLTMVLSTCLQELAKIASAADSIVSIFFIFILF